MPLPVSFGSYRPAAAHGRHSAASAQNLSSQLQTQTITKQTAKLVSHSDSWDEVSSLVVVCAGRRPLHRRPHAVFVVLTDKNAWQLPQRSHVERLKQLALIGSEKKYNQ